MRGLGFVGWGGEIDGAGNTLCKTKKFFISIYCELGIRIL